MTQTDVAVAPGNPGAEGGEDQTAPSPGAPARVTIDSLVRGRVGNLDVEDTARVYSVNNLRYGWVAAISTTDGRQTVIHDPVVIGPPRPVVQRTDIPDRLRR